MKFVLVLAIGLSLTIDSTLGVCCNSLFYPCVIRNTPVIVYKCCGIGACNIFCCNCGGGGCEPPPRHKRSSHLLDSSDFVSSAQYSYLSNKHTVREKNAEKNKSAYAF